MSLSIKQLRQLAVGQLTHQYNSLFEAMSEIKFIQYDPIKSPLCAQDLILFQRIKNYKPGDLATFYPDSEFEEDCLHVYGILSKKFSSLLYPRPHCSKIDDIYKPKDLVADVWQFVCEQGEVLPRDLAVALGRNQVINAWGGKSAATTRALEELHYYGLVRVSKRINGNKVYARSTSVNNEHSLEQRINLLTLLLVELLFPVSESGLRRAIGQLRTASGGLKEYSNAIKNLLAAGKIEYQMIEGVPYYLPTEISTKRSETVDNTVRFLAPFDPIVWDRKRFEHLWGWTYRFEAYMPAHLRQFGYYALPMFWRDEPIGWVNITKDKNGKLNIARGFATKGTYGRNFERAYEHEVNRFEEIIL